MSPELPHVTSWLPACTVACENGQSRAVTQEGRRHVLDKLVQRQPSPGSAPVETTAPEGPGSSPCGKRSVPVELELPALAFQVKTVAPVPLFSAKTPVAAAAWELFCFCFLKPGDPDQTSGGLSWLPPGPQAVSKD